MKCVFCQAYQEREFYILETNLWWVRLNPYPVTEGHLLVIPKRHQVEQGTLTTAEWADLQVAIASALEYIRDIYGVTEYNQVVNSGQAAGQSVFHLHIHLIPRRKGDVEGDPRGGATKFMKPLVAY